MKPKNAVAILIIVIGGAFLTLCTLTFGDCKTCAVPKPEWERSNGEK